MMKLKQVAGTVLAVALLFGGCAAQTPSSTPKKAESEAVQQVKSASASGNAHGTEQTPVRVGAMDGPTGMGMVKLMADAQAGTTANTYEFTVFSGVDEIVPKVTRGEVDIMAAPANLASVLYAKTEKGVRVLAINTLGVLYLAEKGETISNVEDLRGRTIYAAGKGATPEYALTYILTANGLTPGVDVTVEYKSEQAEVVAALAQSENAVAMLPQPFASAAQMKDPEIRIALDLTKEWDTAQIGRTQKSMLVTGVVIVQEAFLKEHPQEVQAFLQEYQASTDYVNANVQESAKLMEQFGIVQAAVAEKAIPFCNITCISGDRMRENLSGYLTVLLEQNPKSIGGAMPDESFYYVGR